MIYQLRWILRRLPEGFRDDNLRLHLPPVVVEYDEKSMKKNARGSLVIQVSYYCSSTLKVGSKRSGSEWKENRNEDRSISSVLY